MDLLPSWSLKRGGGLAVLSPDLKLMADEEYPQAIDGEHGATRATRARPFGPDEV